MKKSKPVLAVVLAALSLSYILEAAEEPVEPPAYPAFWFQVVDAGGLHSEPKLTTMNAGVNRVPDSRGKELDMEGKEYYIFRTSDFLCIDPDGDYCPQVKFPIVPTHGSIYLNGVPIRNGSYIKMVDINNGKLRYTLP